MNVDVNLLTLVLNSLVTLACGGIILFNLYAKKLKKHFFYFAWASGFILYGIQIACRIIFSITLCGTLLVVTAFAFFLGGVGSMSRQKFVPYLTFAIYLFSAIIAMLFFSGEVQLNPSIMLGFTINFIPITIGIFYHRAKFGKAVDKLALGWSCLYLSNVLLWNTEWIIDVFAIFSKLVLLLGIMEYDFLIMSERIRQGNVPPLIPTYTRFENEGGLKIISLRDLSHGREIEWVKSRIQENITKDIDTYIFSFQDVTPHRELWRLKWTSPDKVSVFLFSTSAERTSKEFTVLPMDITQIGALVSEITKKYKNSDKGCTIIFLDLSTLIHLFGVSPVYNMLLDKMGGLREASVKLLAFSHPETHSDQSVSSLFTSIADEVIKL